MYVKKGEKKSAKMCFVIILYVGLVFFILIFRFNIAICFLFLSSLLLFTTIDMVVTVCFHSERMLFANLRRVIAHLYANASQNIPLNEMFAVINVFHGEKIRFFLSLSLSRCIVSIASPEVEYDCVCER